MLEVKCLKTREAVQKSEKEQDGRETINEDNKLTNITNWEKLDTQGAMTI